MPRLALYMVFAVILTIIVVFIINVNETMTDHHHTNHKSVHTNDGSNNSDSYPCSTILSDKEYLEHMIPHHQVAVDISMKLQQQTNNPLMQKILRELIWTQEYEIKLMNSLLSNQPMKKSDNLRMQREYRTTEADYIKPNVVEISKTYCDPHFFDPKAHMKHMEKMNLNEEMYIHHMIPHHQVAVDMSKRLIENTDNDFMIHLAYRIIRSQTKEILLLSDMMKKNAYFHESQFMGEDNDPHY